MRKILALLVSVLAITGFSLSAEGQTPSPSLTAPPPQNQLQLPECSFWNLWGTLTGGCASSQSSSEPAATPSPGPTPSPTAQPTPTPTPSVQPPELSSNMPTITTPQTPSPVPTVIPAAPGATIIQPPPSSSSTPPIVTSPLSSPSPLQQPTSRTQAVSLSVDRTVIPLGENILASGSYAPNSRVKIFINNQVRAETPTGSDGLYSYRIRPRIGDTEIKACSNDGLRCSNSVDFSVSAIHTITGSGTSGAGTEGSSAGSSGAQQACSGTLNQLTFPAAVSAGETFSATVAGLPSGCAGKEFHFNTIKFGAADSTSILLGRCIISDSGGCTISGMTAPAEAGTYSIYAVVAGTNVRKDIHPRQTVTAASAGGTATCAPINALRGTCTPSTGGTGTTATTGSAAGSGTAQTCTPTPATGRTLRTCLQQCGECKNIGTCSDVPGKDYGTVRSSDCTSATKVCCVLLGTSGTASSGGSTTTGTATSGSGTRGGSGSGGTSGAGTGGTATCAPINALRGTCTPSTGGTGTVVSTPAASGAVSTGLPSSQTGGSGSPAAFDFSLSSVSGNPSPSWYTAGRGSSASGTITVKLKSGSAQAVELSCPDSPSGVSCSFNPPSVTPTAAGAASTMTISVSSATPLNSYFMNVKGTAGSVTRSRLIGLTVTAEIPSPVKAIDCSAIFYRSAEAAKAILDYDANKNGKIDGLEGVGAVILFYTNGLSKVQADAVAEFGAKKCEVSAKPCGSIAYSDISAYDANRDKKFSKDDAIGAVLAFFDNQLGKDKAVDAVDAYYSGCDFTAAAASVCANGGGACLTNNMNPIYTVYAGAAFCQQGYEACYCKTGETWSNAENKCKAADSALPATVPADSSRPAEASCSGPMSLSLSRNPVDTSSSFTATASGLSGCDGITIHFQMDTGGWSDRGTCTASGSGCSASITAPSSARNYGYRAKIYGSAISPTSSNIVSGTETLTVNSPR